MEHAWRLFFAYEGEEFTLSSVRKLAKRVPPGQSTRSQRNGYFIELRGPHDEVLYRRSVNELFPDTLEYPTGDPVRPLGRVAAPRHGTVAILVPAEPDARSVAIILVGHSSSADKRNTQQSVEAGGPRELIAVELPREGEQS